MLRTTVTVKLNFGNEDNTNFLDKTGLNEYWIDPVFHYLSWALSCLQLRQLYPEVELYTDDMGCQLLLEEFRLPYTNVNLTLNGFPFPSYLRSASKLKTYALQEGPLLHIDGDVFLSKELIFSSDESTHVDCDSTMELV